MEPRRSSHRRPKAESVQMHEAGDRPLYFQRGKRGVDASGIAGARVAPSALSTPPLQPLRAFHAGPIHQLVSLGPYSLRMGDLILGRASHLDAVSAYRDRTTAIQQCPWQDNWCTGGPTAPVLSY